MADNVQIWNEEPDPSLRYALLRPDAGGVVRAVSVVRGSVLITLDRTRTLTQKEQARIGC